MKPNFKNILFITIDSFRYNRLGIEGYPCNLTPTIDSLVENGIYCSQTIAHSSTTQMSHPSISTSTLPLDFGGYDEGIINRPIALAEILKSNGFNTVSFAGDIELSSYFGYTRGFNEYYPLINVRSQWHPIYYNYIKRHLESDKQLTEKELISIIQPILQKIFTHILRFCHNQLTLKKQGIFINHPSIDFDHYLIIEKVSALLKKLNENPKAFIKYLQQKSDAYDFYNLIDCKKRQGSFFIITALKILEILIPVNLIEIMHQNYQISAGLKPRCLPNGWLSVQLFEKWMNQNTHENNFVWICLNDLHDMLFSKHSVGIPLFYPKYLLKKWKSKSPINNTRHPYDLSVRYEDMLVAELIAIAKKKWSINETLIVICSDHGRQWYLDTDYPKRKKRNILDFYEEDIRVPLLFSNPNLKSQKINHLCGLIDLAPTILDLVGLEKEPSFKGLPVYSKKVQERPYLIMEDADRGPCDILNKPIRINVRTNKYKYLWQEASSEKPERNELYDLILDPKEQRNIVDEEKVKHISQQLKTIIINRFNELKNKTKIPTL